jgi:hypothetical protein
MTKRVRLAVCLILCSATLATWRDTAVAQNAVAVPRSSAPIFLRPDPNRTPLFTADVNTRLSVLERDGDWIKVEFMDPRLGRRIGYRILVRAGPQRSIKVRVHKPRPAWDSASSCTRQQLGSARRLPERRRSIGGSNRTKLATHTEKLSFA